MPFIVINVYKDKKSPKVNNGRSEKTSKPDIREIDYSVTKLIEKYKILDTRLSKLERLQRTVEREKAATEAAAEYFTFYPKD